MNAKIGMTAMTGDLPSTHQITPAQISAMFRDLQRKNVALEKILSIVGEGTPAGRVCKEAMGTRNGT